MKLLIYVLTTTSFLFTVNFSLSHAWASDGDDSGTLLCDKNKVMELKEAVNKCKQLAYLNFLEEKLANVNDFKARCDYLDYEVSTYSSLLNKQPCTFILLENFFPPVSPYLRVHNA